MIWPIACTLVAVFYAFRSTKRIDPMADEDEKDDAKFLTVIAVLAIAVASFLLTGLISWQCLPSWEKDEEEGETIELLAIGNENKPGEKFFLTIKDDGNVQYYYYQKKTDSGYQPEKMMARDNTTVLEHDHMTNEGELKKYTIKFSNPYGEGISWFWINFTPPNKTRYEFVVPKGTVQRSFNK